MGHEGQAIRVRLHSEARERGETVEGSLAYM